LRTERTNPIHDFQAAIDKMIEENKRESISQIPWKGLANKPIEETTALIPPAIPRIMSFSNFFF
jgi:hypothetical protein